jgi:mannitol-1-phosphate/altronate dehydrogenase
VVERGNGDSAARVVGSMVEYLLLADSRQDVLARLCDPGIRLVTLTVTADGYALPADTSPGAESLFAVLAEALDVRRGRRIAPFTVMSCDNLPDSSAMTRQAVLAYAGRHADRLAEWVDGHVTFPGSMVDRITPATTPEDRDAVEEEFGVEDRWPVITEPFAQWVIEDRFCNDRPPLDRVGARFVDDVAPYKLIKSRMLNGVHCALGYVGCLAGHTDTCQALADPVVAGYAEHLLREEIAPLLPAGVPGMELDAYRTTLLNRFRNPAIGDQLSRLCRRGSTKMPDYLLPSLHEARARNAPHRALDLAVAAWMRYLRGTDLAGAPIQVQDARADELREAAERGGADPGPLLDHTDVFGDLREDPRSVRQIRASLAAMDRDGIRAAIAAATR